MAKAAILDVLENTIGKYVLNLDAESLNVAVWAGKIELNSLKLNVEAVNKEIARQAADAPNLALPFRVASGSFRHLEVDVPWARLTSRPVLMRLEGLDIILEPYDHLSAKYDQSYKSKIDQCHTTNADEKMMSPSTKKKKKNKDERSIAISYAEEGRQRANTMRKLAELEEVVDEIQESVDDKSEQVRSSSRGFKAKLVRRIIENLQIDIHGVKVELRSQGCVMGVSLDLFSICTTDKHGNRSFVDRATNTCNVEKSFIYKVLQLKGLGIYCDEERQEREFILSPLSLEAKLRQSDFIQCVDFPKYLISTNLPSISVQLRRTQLELIHKVTSEIAEKKHVSRPLFPEYRPEEALNGKNAKLWWKYAVRSIGRISRRRSWTEFFIAYQKRKQYIPLYKRSIAKDCSWVSPITEREIIFLQEIEMDKTIAIQGLMNWRNIAEAQIELERKKFEAIEASRNKTTPRKRFFAFGGNKAEKNDDSTSISGDDRDAPMTLSKSEMKELENIAVEDYFEDNKLSSDSILYDIKFHLGSFGIELITFASRPLALFQMGSLSSSFKANADGSFVAKFQMSSLNVRDQFTTRTLFPHVVRSLEYKSDLDQFSYALAFQFKKAKNGDQHLEASLVSFEITACDLFLRECKRFFTFTDNDHQTLIQSNKNPTLEYSVSGAVDLFYDANDPLARSSTDSLNGPKVDVSEVKTSKVSDKLASAFSDAWKSKLEKKISWQVQLVIRAPILVLPQSNTDPMATVLVADLGTFRFIYGGGSLAESVRQWFGSKMVGTEIAIDRCSLDMRDFTFLIGRAGNKDWLKAEKSSILSTKTSETVLEPINFSLDVGIENGQEQRRCGFGILPSISLNITYSHIINIMSVISTWLDFASSFGREDDTFLGLEVISEGSEEQSQGFQRSEMVQQINSNSSFKRRIHCGENCKTPKNDGGETYLSLALQRLSLCITNDDNKSIEAHLILAETFTSFLPNGHSSIRVRMGCFWVIDNLASKFPRKQRLVVHSVLPRPAASYAENDCYDILLDLETQGIFDGNLNTASLADVNITRSNQVSDSSIGEASVIIQHGKLYPVSMIDAKFSTLFLHWNPHAVRNIMEFIADVQGFMSKLQFEKRNERHTSNPRPIVNESLFILNAEMEAFEIFLNSAKDDLPLFVLKMCDARIQFHATKDRIENQDATVSLGDLRVEVVPSTKILPEYSTILGLASQCSNSLLCIEYEKGPLAISGSSFDYIDKEMTEMVIDVSLSAMRFVHVQAQVLTLVEYVNEGVLGAVTKRVASSAAQAALELSHKELLGRNIFYVRASGFDLVIPQAAYSLDFFALHVGIMSVHFTAFPTPGEGAAVIALEEVTMKCNRDEEIIDTPIRLDVDVSLAPLDAATLDDQATRVKVSTSTADFLLTRQHYIQIMKTLEFNIGELNSFLRDNHRVVNTKNGMMYDKSKTLTHGGVEEVVIKKRIYMTFKFEELVLQLCDETYADPILSINAVETNIQIRLFPHEDSIQIDATLNDLVVEDQRISTIGRHFRKLVRQVEDTSMLDPDVFKLQYFQSKPDQAQSITIELGRPQLVFIPDLIADVMGYFKRNETLPDTIQIASGKSLLKSLDNNQALDDCFSISDHNKVRQKVLKTLNFKLKTADCRLVLLDMGTATSNASTWSETIVLQGQTEANAKLVTDLMTGDLVRNSLEIHGDNFEVYTAQGEKLVSPVQLVNPIRFSTFLSTKVKDEDHMVDFSFVTLSSVYATLSMQNYSLLNAIASSTSEAWAQESSNKDSQIKLEEKPLSQDVMNEIRKITNELENEVLDATLVDTCAELSFLDGTPTAPLSSQSSMTNIVRQRAISIKLTLPETILVVVNDLQGLDDALFKVTMQSCVMAGNASFDDTAKDRAILQFHINTNILADYFDSHTKVWEPFLMRPWEIDFKASRSKKKGTWRLTTVLDIESSPCQVSFSEQLIISLRGATSMWSLYSETTKKAMDILLQANQIDKMRVSFVGARAKFCARAMTTTMPYGIENRTGYSITFDVKEETLDAPNNKTTFFDFPLPEGEGIGGSRLYGQDCVVKKSIDITINGEYVIHFEHLDDEIHRPTRSHRLNDSVVFSEVVKTGKAVIIKITSFMSILNETNLKFAVSLKVGSCSESIGVCTGKQLGATRVNQSFQKAKLSISAASLQKAYQNHNAHAENIAIQLFHGTLVGEVTLPPYKAFYTMGKSKSPMKTFEIVCSSSAIDKNDTRNKMILKIGCKVTTIDDFPFVELFVQPRMLLQNCMCINIFIKTLMPHIYINGQSGDVSSMDGTTLFRVEPYESLEIYSPGKSAVFAFRCADIPVGHHKTGWNKPGWIEIPLSITSQMEGRVDCSFPIEKSSEDESPSQGGSLFFISETLMSAAHLSSPKIRMITVNLENVGVDHTGDFLFENVTKASKPFTLFSFSSSYQSRRITLLPTHNNLIQLVQLSTGRRTKAFSIDDIAFTNGGIDSTPILWNDSSRESGFFAYKKLAYHKKSENVHNQLEIHIIPAIIIYNSGDHGVQVSYSGGYDLNVDSGKMGPVHQSWSGDNGVVFVINFTTLGCATSPIKISKTGLLVAVVKSTATGSPVGSVAIQTMVGGKDSRHVIKIGPMKHGNVAAVDSNQNSISPFQNDFIRFRIRWSQMEVTFLDTSKPSENNDFEIGISQNSNIIVKSKITSYAKVAQMMLSRFTVDFQKVFKDDVVSATMEKRSHARSQFAVIIHSIHLKDFTTVDTGTTVLTSTSQVSNFFELCIRTRDVSEISGVNNIDLLELKLANNGKVADKVILNTTEAFLWSLLDISSRTINASKEFATLGTNIKWDKEKDIFIVEAIEKSTNEDDEEDNGNYSTPRNIKLYAIKKANVFPTSFLLSFKRQPQTSRYEKVKNVKSAKIVDYFTKKLNFTVDKANLKFSGFQVHNVKGPPERVIELVTTFYAHQMKSKIFTLLTSTSIDEWQQLAGRDEGEKGYIEGDLLRTAGNLGGKSAGYLVKKVGEGINFGLTAGTAEVGNGIQSLSEAVGVGAVGAGVNSVISGIGGGVGSTVQGVGEGGSKIIKGAGKGVGQIVGGVGGGLLLAGKGVGKGVRDGDGKAIITGLGDGVVSIGSGIVKGGESVVVGVGDGVYSVGKGLFNGVKNIGMGLGGAVTGKKTDSKQVQTRNNQTNSNRDKHKGQR